MTERLPGHLGVRRNGETPRLDLGSMGHAHVKVCMHCTYQLEPEESCTCADTCKWPGCPKEGLRRDPLWFDDYVPPPVPRFESIESTKQSKEKD